MATAGQVHAQDGTVIPAAVESICLHGDTPGAVTLARRIRAGLLDAGVALEPFVGRTER
jgi:UPF0271 protein